MATTTRLALSISGTGHGHFLGAARLARLLAGAGAGAEEKSDLSPDGITGLQETEANTKQLFAGCMNDSGAHCRHVLCQGVMMHDRRLGSRPRADTSLPWVRLSTAPTGPAVETQARTPASRLLHLLVTSR
jgi:hypothetical protein